jgi:hypothetical protein
MLSAWKSGIYAIYNNRLITRVAGYRRRRFHTGHNYFVQMSPKADALQHLRSIST